MKKTLLLLTLLLTALGNASAEKYWVTAKTVPDYWTGNANTVEFSLDVNINGTAATISGWRNLGIAKGATPKDTLGSITGTYDEATRTITVATPKYDYNKTEDDYTDLYYASVEEWGYTNTYRYILLSCTYGDDYNIPDHDSLTFKVSDDLSTITAEQNVRVGNMYYYDYNNSWFLSSSDYYESFVMEKMPEEASIVSSSSLVDLSSIYLTPGKTTSESFTLTNKGQSATDYSITTSDPQLTVDSLATGNIEGGSSRTITFTLAPTEPNEAFDQYLNIAYGDKTIKVEVKATVSQQQDYSKIVSAGDFTFYNDDDNKPYNVDETTYGKAVAKASAEAGDVSTFNVKFTVPEGKVGTLAWNGEAKNVRANINFRSNIFENSNYRWILNSNPSVADGTVSLDGSALFLPGDYDYKFYTSISQTGDDAHVYLDNLSLTLSDLQEHEAQLLNDSLNFGTSYAGGDTVSLSGTVTLRNKGSEPLSVTSIESDNAEFGGTVPTATAETLNDLNVTLTFNGVTTGKHTGTVTLHTSAGDFKVPVSAELTELPYDYKPIVKNGDFLFNTSYEHPFLVNDTADTVYAYNSTTGKQAAGNAESWLDVSFSVPDGTTAVLAWNGKNSSAERDYSWWTGGYTLLDGTRITIDGTKSVEIGGENDASSAVFDAADLTFAPGHHVVRFLYKKQNESPTGDDQLKLSQLDLEIEAAKADTAVINAAGINFSSTSVLRKSWATVLLRNLGQNELKLTSVTGTDDGVFGALIPEEGVKTLDTLKVDVFMAPTTVGTHTGNVVLHTTAGDFTLACNGEADYVYDSDELPVTDSVATIFQEDFEHGIDRWTLIPDENGRSFNRSSDDVYYLFEAGGYLHFTVHDNDAALAYASRGAMVSPEFEVPEKGKSYLSYYSFASQTNAAVIYGPDLEYGLDDFDTLYVDSCDLGFIYMPQRGTRWYRRTIDITSLAGQTVRLGWQPDGGSFYVLDDVLAFNVPNRSATDGISGVNAEDGNKTARTEIYNINGVRTDRMSRGLNIIRSVGEDGKVSVRKVVVK